MSDDDHPRDVRDLRLIYKAIAWAIGILIAGVVGAWVTAGVILPWAREINNNDLLHTFRLEAQKERLEAQDRRMDGQDKRMDGVERTLRFHERGHAPSVREGFQPFPSIERPRSRPTQ